MVKTNITLSYLSSDTLVLQGRIIIAVHRAFVSGCEGPSIAELCSVATRESCSAGVKPNHLVLSIYLIYLISSRVELTLRHLRPTATSLAALHEERGHRGEGLVP